LQVHFIDVGQGDSILVDLEETEILIDGGDKSPGVVEYISEYVDGALEAVVATHPHADHIGGLIAVLNTFDIEEIWHNGDSATSKTYGEFMAAVRAEDALVNVGKRGDKIDVGGLSFMILNPDKLDGSTNNNSIVLSIQYGNIDFLFTGDAEQEAESSMLLSGVVPVSDVKTLKVGHHGSSTSSSNDFLTAISPEIAIYMAGKDNRYGHPHEETIVFLSDIGAEIYGTDVHGSIVVTTNGEDCEVQLEKQAPPIKPPDDS
jgi:beta-lactamase superfamily II metal-dependent hydrolase